MNAERMDVIDDVDALRARTGDRVCVLAETEDSPVAQEASRALGVDLDAAGHPHRHRPSVLVAGGQVDLVVMILTDDRRQLPLRLVSRGQGVVLIGQRDALDTVRPGLVSVHPAEGRPEVLTAVMAVARRCEEVLSEIDEDAQALAERAIGYSSSSQRRTVARLRAHLFRIGETQATQRNLLSPEEELADALGPDHRRALARAALAFGANQSTATRLYAMLGDVQNEQDSVVSERLTLVATIFLPLTLATGFFGMNFQWMTDRIGGPLAFLLLGIVVPLALAAATLTVVRRLTRST